MARSRNTPRTIQNVLDAKDDVVPLPLSRDFDPVLEARDGSVRPATTTVLRDVLVQHFG